MAKMNTLFRKGYLLAGVTMAANMFIINEMKATDTTLTTNIKKTREPEEENNTDRIFLYTDDIDQEDKDGKAPETQPKQNIMDKVLSKVLYWENPINLIGGAVFSVANNYFKWCDYNPGKYWQFGCLGWRSKKFLNGVLQFEVNFVNLGRGAFWLIATLFGSYEYLKQKKDPKELTSTAAVIMNYTWTYDTMGHILFYLLSSLQGFVSTPLAIHISNFSIAISLDSILWVLASGLSTIVRGKKKKNEEDSIFNLLEKGETENNNQEGNDIN